MSKFSVSKLKENDMEFEIIRPGPGRLIRALIDELKIIETINNMVHWDPKQWKISPGELITALIISFFCERHALYKVRDFYKHQDLDLLFGRKDLSANDFNDDCLARSLERLEDCEFHKLYGLILVNLRHVYQFHPNAATLIQPPSFSSATMTTRTKSW
jgi:hypothetical protein